ncbi:MAG: polysaccharide deacetylase family protein, partial [Planctomycetes bacterium]|nr:polysaccharide deacetylase family protein [Planctomycetota bacterium]
MNVARTLAIGLAAVSIWQAAEAAKRPALRPIPEGLVVLTFDDANISDRTLVAGVLKKHGFGATFYVTEGLGFLKSKDHYTTWKQIRELHEMGFEIGNHTQHHRNVTRLSREQLNASLRHIEKRCAEHAIAKPTTFCYPGFSHNLTSMRVVEAMGYQFARRGVRPEFSDGGKGSRGPAYDPRVDHPLLVPTTSYAGPDWGMDDLRWAVDQAAGGRITVLCYHGVPAIEHSWVSTSPEDFAKQMQYLKQQKCTVIAMRDLAKYVDPSRRPADPYQPINRRVRQPRELSSRAIPNPLGLRFSEVALRWTVPHGFGQQTAFQVLVASDEQKLAVDVGDRWDSRRRYSNRHTDVIYSGAALASNRQFWWKVRVWDKDGQPGRFSDPATFKTAKQQSAKATKRRAAAQGGKLRYIAGRIGKAVQFDHAAATIRMADYPELRPRAGTTICAWIKPSTMTDEWQTIFRKEDGNQRRLLSIGRTDDVWGLWLGLGIANQYREFGAKYAKEKLADGQWHHVAGSFDGEWLRLYVDGKQIGEQRVPGPLDAGGGAAAFVGSYEDRREPFHGGIDELQIYSRGLSTEQIAKLAAAAPCGQEAHIVAWLKLDGNLDNEATIAAPVSTMSCSSMSRRAWCSAERRSSRCARARRTSEMPTRR